MFLLTNMGFLLCVCCVLGCARVMSVMFVMVVTVMAVEVARNDTTVSRMAMVMLTNMVAVTKPVKKVTLI